MAQIVLAYAREDVAVAQLLKESLEQRGYSAFLDVSDLIEGEWRSFIDRQIRTSLDVVVLVSEHAAKSDEVAREVQVAQSSHKNVIPVLLDEEISPSSAWLKELLEHQAVRYDRLDLRVSTTRIAEHLTGRRSPFRIHNNRFWIGLAAALAIALGLYIIFGSPQVSNPPQSPRQAKARGSAIVYDGFKAYEKSGFRFASRELVRWDSRSADVLAARPEGQATTHLFLPYDAESYKNPDLDSNARAGIQEIAAGSLDSVSACPSDGYVHHWYRPKVGMLYCVRWRSGDGYSAIRVDTVDSDRIGFDYVVIQPGVGDSQR